MQGPISPFQDCTATCSRILHDNWGLRKFPLHWIRHSLSPNQQSEPISSSMTRLKDVPQTGFERIVISDESWSFRPVSVTLLGRRLEMGCLEG
jgi:hypothetical protein